MRVGNLAGAFSMQWGGKQTVVMTRSREGTLRKIRKVGQNFFLKTSILYREILFISIIKCSSVVTIPLLYSNLSHSQICWGLFSFSSSFFFFSDCATRLAGSQFPDQGLNPGPLQWKCRVLTTGQPGNSPIHRFVNHLFHIQLILIIVDFISSNSSNH